MELNVPRAEISILLSTKNTTFMRIWAILRLWGGKEKYEKNNNNNKKKKKKKKKKKTKKQKKKTKKKTTTTYDHGRTRTQDSPFGSPTDYLLS